MSDDQKPRSPGCVLRLLSTFLLLAAIGLAAALYFVFQPQNLSDVKKASEGPARDLSLALRNATERGYDLRLSEGDLNAWLAQTLQKKQTGVFGESVTLEAVYIRLEKDVAEVILERKIFGRPFTVSMFLRIEQTESAEGVSTALHRDAGPFLKSLPNLKKGGRFGKLVIPQGLLLLVMPSYVELKDQFKEEISNGFEKMARVKIDDDYLILDPRDDVSSDPKTPGIF